MKLDLTGVDGKKVTIESDDILTMSDEGPHRVVVYRIVYRVTVKEKAKTLNKMIQGLPLTADDKKFTSADDLPKVAPT